MLKDLYKVLFKRFFYYWIISDVKVNNYLSFWKRLNFNKTKSNKYEILFLISKSIDISQNKVKEKAVIFCHRFKDVSEKDMIIFAN